MDGAYSIFAVLLSGAIGALLATGLTVAFTIWKEQVQLKSDAMLAVVRWADDTYLRVMDLRTSKQAAYVGDKPYLAEQEYAHNSRELRSLLLRASIPAQLGIAYGDGKEVELLNELRSHLLRASQILWKARKDSWSNADAEVQQLFKDEIDPLRTRLERKLLERSSLPLMWKKIEQGPDWSGVDAKEW